MMKAIFYHSLNIFILKFMAHVWHGYIFSELSSHFIVDTEQRYQINIQTLRIVLYFLVMFFILESPSSQSLLFASSCHPLQGLFSSQIIASCLGFVLDCVLTIYEMQNWGRRAARVKMINSKLIILLLLLGSIGPGQGQMGWGHSAPPGPAFTRLLTLPVLLSRAKLLRENRNKTKSINTQNYAWTFCAENVWLFRYLFVSCCQAAVTQHSLRHVTSLRDSFHDSSHRASHSPLLSDSLLNLSLATRLLARVDLGDLASNSARFCRWIQIYWGRLFRKWLKISLMAAELAVYLIKTLLLTLSGNWSPDNFSRRGIPGASYQLHVVHCARNITLCKACDEPIPRAEYEEHVAEECPMRMVECSLCGARVEAAKLENHKVSQEMRTGLGINNSVKPMCL